MTDPIAPRTPDPEQVAEAITVMVETMTVDGTPDDVYEAIVIATIRQLAASAKLNAADLFLLMD